LARRPLKPQLNQIRTWVRQGRTDAWIAHQLEVSVSDIRSFKREHELAPAEEGDEGAPSPGLPPEEPDLRAEDDALVAAALEAEREAQEATQEDVEVAGEAAEDVAPADAEELTARAGGPTEAAADATEDESEEEGRARRRRGRRGGRGRRRRRGGRALEGTFDHGEEGYGLWLDPAVQDDPVYAEHWAGHRPVTVTVEPERIVITRTGEDGTPEEGDEDES
jgi:hypothetical protein